MTLGQDISLSMNPEGIEPLIPAICFIVPTFNRASVLIQCLEHLERQTFTNFEVVVVDDGSTDSTEDRMKQYLAEGKLRIRYVRQENRGQARARNVAAALAQAPLCVMIGDDIFCSPRFAEIHVRLHQERPEITVAGLGLTQWDTAGQHVTSFMQWMDESGSQFAYGDLLTGTSPDWRHFYTSNLSIKTKLLRLHPFNERFKRYGMEDMELGYRLEVESGLQLVFLPSALATHLHPTNFERACQRAYTTGESLNLFDQLWPARPVSQHSLVHRGARDLLCWNSWLLRPATALIGFVTRYWCPNPFLGPILAYHTALGRRKANFK